MSKEEELAKVLKNLREKYGDYVVDSICDMLIDIVSDEFKLRLLLPKLEEIGEIQELKYRGVILTEMERDVYEFVKNCLETNYYVTVKDIHESDLPKKYSSLRHPNLISKVLNSLVEKGLLGKVRVGKTVGFTTPEEAIKEALRLMPDRKNIDVNIWEISKVTGLPVEKILAVLKSMSG
jgi:hypothetical protein